MKKTLVVLFIVLVGLMFNGCARQKHCYYFPPLNEIQEVRTGDIMIRKVECVGRATVNECSISLDLVYLGNTGTYIRMGQRSGISGYIVGNTSSVGIGQRSGVVFGKSDFQASIVFPSITEFTYPIDSRSIDFQGTKFQVTDIEDVRIKFRLVDIPINGCNKVNGQEVSQEGPTKSE